MINLYSKYCNLKVKLSTALIKIYLKHNSILKIGIGINRIKIFALITILWGIIIRLYFNPAPDGRHDIRLFHSIITFTQNSIFIYLNYNIVIIIIYFPPSSNKPSISSGTNGRGANFSHFRIFRLWQLYEDKLINLNFQHNLPLPCLNHSREKIKTKLRYFYS